MVLQCKKARTVLGNLQVNGRDGSPAIDHKVKRSITSVPDSTPCDEEDKDMEVDTQTDTTPDGKHYGVLTIPQQFRFTADEKFQRGISETYEYTDAIGSWHIRMELDNLPDPRGFLNIQKDVKPRMRTILFMWLVDVHRKFNGVEEVLWRTFEIIDRYLASQATRRKDLQLIACASLWIASKYHEIYPPTADDLVHVSDKAFKKTELVKMEMRLCRHFSMKFSYPTAFDFLTRYTAIALASIQVPKSREEKVKTRIRFLAMYGMERMIMDMHSLLYKPSLLAACSLFTAMSLISHNWTTEMEQATGYTERDFREKYELYKKIKKQVMDFTSQAHGAVIRKYATPERGEVSSLRKKVPPRKSEDTARARRPKRTTRSPANIKARTSGKRRRKTSP